MNFQRCANNRMCQCVKLKIILYHFLSVLGVSVVQFSFPGVIAVHGHSVVQFFSLFYRSVISLLSAKKPLFALCFALCYLSHSALTSSLKTLDFALFISTLILRSMAFRAEL